MMISTKGRYALRVMAALAAAPEGVPVPLKEVAQEEQISEKYLEAIIKAGRPVPGQISAHPCPFGRGWIGSSGLIFPVLPWPSWRSRCGSGPKAPAEFDIWGRRTRRRPPFFVGAAKKLHNKPIDTIGLLW